MENHSLPQAEKYTTQHKRRRLWQKIVSCLACVVVFVTTYMLILPAITMEETVYCGHEAHAHGPECYERRLVCGYDETEPAEPAEPEEAPEAEPEGHTHGAECYAQEQVLVCDQEETPGHVHDESCVQTEEILICTETDENHEHTPECYEITETYICGQTEGEGGHTHGPECYETVDVLICDQPEEIVETAEEETAEEPEAVHIHTEACYEDVLICGKEEHEHDLSCYSNPEADVESREVWERSVSNVELTGVWADDVIAIAESQIGYTESTRNYIVTEDGKTKGYTRYGAWYGDPYGDWCAMFVSFCLNYAQAEGMPLEANCQRWIETLSQPEYGLYQAVDSDTPAAGDLIFFDWDGDGAANHVGLVAELTLDEESNPVQIKTIEGNSGDQVRYVTYDAGDSSILGYGRLPEQNLEADELAEQVLELAEQTLTATIYEDESYTQEAQEETVITVTGLLPLDAEVKAFPVTVETEAQVLCAYDIAILLPDGTLYEPAEGEVMNVSIQRADLGALEEPLHPEVYYQPEEGEPERMESQVTPEGVAFDTDHFSVYMVLAINETQVKTAAELKTAIANSNSSIQLAAGFTVSESLTIPENADITLDLNGHTLTASGTGALFTIPADAALTIVDSQQKAETVNTASGSLAGNTASLSDGTLTYYVTTTSVTNSATGATQETLKKHTVSVAGSIVGGSQPVFQVTGGTLNLQSGMIRSGTGRAVVQTGGTTNFSGGYICGFDQPFDNKNSINSVNFTEADYGGALRITGGTLYLTQDGVLAANQAACGGAIFLGGSASMNMDGGIISGNVSAADPPNWDGEDPQYHSGGGGICASGNAEVTMSGGYITNNVANSPWYFDGGGGVFLKGSSRMALTGGYITGNEANAGGGIKTAFKDTTLLTMTGGHVSANITTKAEGGGIAIDRNSVGTITGGYITNNKIPNTVHWGGGGLFCADGSTLNLKNTLITENTCGGFGAGVAGCPTGKLYLYVNEGCAIYDNRDTVNSDSPHFTSDGVKQIDKEICTEVFQSNGHADYFCALNSTVTGTMLGNNAANWQGSADYQPVIADAEDVLTATRVMGLKANPTAAAKSAAQAAAKVYINGNYSYTHGGGIMCNGNLVIGVPVNVEVPARVELQATKKLVDGSGNAQSLEDNDFSFKVTMTEPDGTVIASGVCDSSGKITFDHQLTFKQEGTFVYYVYEEVDEENTSVKFDPTLYRLTVTVTKDNGVAWYGDTIKYTYSVTSVKVESSTDRVTWTPVSQSDTSQSGIISLPLTSGTTFTNHLIQPTKVTVQKKWEGGSGTDSVTVILKQDGAEFDRQILKAENEWSYTWDNLEPGHSYTVEEVEVPGYTASYEITTSTDDSGSTSLGQGSWWVPATELTAGQQYLIVSPDGTKALCVASGGEGDGFNTADVTSVTQQQTALTVNGQTYSTWYQAADIPARSIYNAEALTRNSHSGIILKRSDGGSYPYLRLESNNNNYLKGASATGYASFMVFDGTYLKGHNASEWTPDNLRTLIYADGKFNSTTEQSPANAVKLYTLVSGEGFTGTTTDSTTVVITNTKEVSQDYVLPDTGGTGTNLYTIGGLLLMAGAGLLLLYRSRKRREEAWSSS